MTIIMRVYFESLTKEIILLRFLIESIIKLERRVEIRTVMSVTG